MAEQRRSLLDLLKEYAEVLVSVAALVTAVAAVVITIEQTKVMRGTPYLQVTVCYCSLYGDCFQTELFRRPQQVDACEAADKPFISHGFFRN